MLSSKLIKLSSPVARSCLIAISVALLIDAVLTLLAANHYPYLLDQLNDEFYMTNSHTITVVYTGTAIAAILISVLTVVATYKNATNYVLIHAGITSIFLPVSIVVYFSASSSRYKVGDNLNDYYNMIADYRINTKRKTTIRTDLDPSTNSSESRKSTINSFVNLIDILQTKLSCCGVESVHDWTSKYDNYISPSCCGKHLVTTSETWAKKFNVESDHEFEHCTETNSYHLGCLAALKEEERGKYDWLSDLIVFMILITIANTIVSLLLFGLSKTEETTYHGNQHELSIVGVSSKPRPSQPTITSIKHRPSVVASPLEPPGVNMTSRAQAVRFNISTSPRTSISSGSKFSAAARRGSSFI